MGASSEIGDEELVYAYKVVAVSSSQADSYGVAFLVLVAFNFDQNGVVA